jgi:hypothetical protein
MDNEITKVYYGHYLYIKKHDDKSYITTMRQSAEALINGIAPEVQLYSPIVGFPNPMSVTNGHPSIVFDPDYLKQNKN